MAQLLNGILDSIPAAARKPVQARDLINGKDVTLKAAAAEPLSALVFKTIVDPYGKMSYIRVFSGELSANSTVFNPRTAKTSGSGNSTWYAAGSRPPSPPLVPATSASPPSLAM